jgi:hypothetical protein
MVRAIISARAEKSARHEFGSLLLLPLVNRFADGAETVVKRDSLATIPTGVIS